ncbi:hypothetical protein V2J09_023541 [Rumex salicifolius]
MRLQFRTSQLLICNSAMFWRMAGLSTASPVETILDKDKFTLEELLDEDEVIQECKAINSRLINFLRERTQIEQLVRYIVEEAPDDAEKKRTFKFPFISCEIFTCEVDIILRTLATDEELLDLLFSFLDPNRPHSTLTAGYFSKVVICLLLRKTVPIMNYIQAHQEIMRQMVDLIGITSIMEVLVRLIGADENIYANYAEAVRWLEEVDVLEMIVDKFVSSDYSQVHANAAETLCAIARYAPPALAAKVSSPSFVKRLLHNALEENHPKSVLVYSLTICICLLDPKKMTFGTSSYYMYSQQYAQGSSISANPETVEGMLESLEQLLKLLDISSDQSILPTTYGKLQPALGKHRLKLIEFIAVLLSAGNDAAEKELIKLGAIQRILDLFFEYPFNNFLHHHAESIILSCLESKSSSLVEHILRDCNLVQNILEAENNSTLSHDPKKPTVAIEEKQPPRIGNIGHLTRLSNKLLQLGNSNNEIHACLQENSEWVNWSSTVLSKRNAVENVYQWTCGRPTTLQDRRDSDDDDYQDRDYDVAALANNLSQPFLYGIYTNDMEEGQGSLDRDEEDVYFDDESAEVVISSLRLGGNHESDDGETDDTASSSYSPEKPQTKPPELLATPVETSSEDAKQTDDPIQTENKSPEWVQWRETSILGEETESETPLPSGAPEEPIKSQADDPSPITTDPSPPPDESNQHQTASQESTSTENLPETEMQKQV